MTPTEAKRRLAAEAAKETRGADAVFVSVTGTGANSGAVTETETQTTVRLFGPLSEQRISEAEGSRAQFVLPAYGLTLTPRVGDRIVTGAVVEGDTGRTWMVAGIETAEASGVTIGWTLACAEQTGSVL